MAILTRLIKFRPLLTITRINHFGPYTKCFHAQRVSWLRVGAPTLTILTKYTPWLIITRLNSLDPYTNHSIYAFHDTTHFFVTFAMILRSIVDTTLVRLSINLVDHRKSSHKFFSLSYAFEEETNLLRLVL